jgi:hypothetical protein
MTAAWLLWACAPDEEPEELGEDEPYCDNMVTAIFPAGGVDQVFYRTEVYANLGEEDPGARLVVRGPDGLEVPGDAQIEGTLLSWSGEPLLPLTTYETTLSYTCGEFQWTWTTSAFGAPLEADPTGQVYSLLLEEGSWRMPAGLDGLASGLRLLVSPWQLGEQGPSLASAMSQGEQEPCLPTPSLSSEVWLDPWFEASSSEPIPFFFWDRPSQLDTPRLSAAFSADGQRLRGTLTGLLHTEDLGPAFLLDDRRRAVCDWLEQQQYASCEPCPVGETDTCLRLWIEDLEGLPLEQPLVDRTVAEIEADPSCAEP